MTKKDILLDLDSIIVNLDGVWYPTYNAKYDDNLTIDKVVSWDLHKFCRQDLLGVDHPIHPVYGIINEPGFFLRPDPMPGAVEGVRRLMDLGHNVLLVSAGMDNALSDKYKWVAKHLPFFDVRKKLILAYEKRVIKGDVLFDDGPHNCESYRKAWPNSYIATVCYPYNKDGRQHCDLIAGHHRNMAEAWATFVHWVEAGCPRIDRPLFTHGQPVQLLPPEARFQGKLPDGPTDLIRPDSFARGGTTAPTSPL